jgi:ribosome maturation factor RimP
LLEKARSVVLPVLANLGYDLVEVAIVVSHGRRTLRVFIDKENGVDVSDCARASKSLSPALDEQGFFPGRYYLEVSSPGAERKLRTREDFRHFVGRKARVRLREVCMGMTEVKGKIEGFRDDMLELRPEGNSVVTIPFETISSANLCL